MELATYLQILKRRQWIIILTTLAAVTAFFFVQPHIPTTYKATAILRITPYTSSNPSYNTLMYADRIMNNYVKIASSSILMNQIRERLALSPDQPKEITVEIIPDSEMLLITAEDYSPVVAYDAAKTMVALLSEIKINRDIRISIVDPATLPEPPSALMVLMAPVLVVIVGVTGGVGLAFVFENLDTRLYTTEGIKAVTQLPVLGKILKVGKLSKGPYFLHDPNMSNGIRSLRTFLIAKEANPPLKTILVMSTYPKEGKSTIASNLVISLALTGKKTLIVDADLYFPRIHKIFNLSNESGLSDLLGDSVSIHEVIKDSGLRDISVLTSGPKTPESTELLGSPGMKFLLKQLSEIYDYIVIDAPAFLGIPDTAMLAPIVDTVILIVRCGLVDESALLTTLQELNQLGVQPLGVVINHANEALPSLYRNYQRSIKDYDPVEKLKLPASDTDPTGRSTVNGKLEQPTEMFVASQRPVEQPDDTEESEPFSETTSQSKVQLVNIRGIGPVYDKVLKAIGIGTIEQLAKQNPDDLINRMDGRIKKPNVIEDWINQALVLIRRENHSPATKKSKIKVLDVNEETASTSKGDSKTQRKQAEYKESENVNQIGITGNGIRQVVEDLAIEDVDTNGLLLSKGKEKPITLVIPENLDLSGETAEAEIWGDERYIERDNLSEIHGIGPAYEKALNELGITTFAQLAEQDADDLMVLLDWKVKKAVIVDWIYQAFEIVQNEKYEPSSPWENAPSAPFDL